MHIRPRSDWGPRYRAGFGSVSLPVRELWLHHSVTGKPAHNLDAERAAMRTLENIGQQRFGGGISYTLAFMPSGRVYEGTGVGRLGAHTGGRNSISHAFVLVGDYSTVGPTVAQQNSIAETLREGKARNWWLHAALNGGHRDVKSTGCPGDAAYRLIPQMNRIAAGSPTVAPPTQPKEPKLLDFDIVEIPADGKYHSIPFPPPGRSDVGTVYLSFSGVGKDGENPPASSLRIALYFGDGRFAGVADPFKVGRGRFALPLTSALKDQRLGSASALNRGPHNVSCLVELVR